MIDVRRTAQYTDTPCLVIADVHAPHADIDFLREIVQRQSYRRIIIAGDLFDFPQLSTYPPDEPPPSLDTTLEAAGEVLRLCAAYAPLTVFGGNHDRRFVATLKHSFSFAHLINAALAATTSLSVHPTIEASLTKLHPVTVCTYEYVQVGSFLVIHGHTSHRVPGMAAAKLALSYKMPVLMGHDHVQGIAHIQHAVGISIGMVACPNAFTYALRQLRGYPPMVQGYAVLPTPHEVVLYGRDHSFNGSVRCLSDRILLRFYLPKEEPSCLPSC